MLNNCIFCLNIVIALLLLPGRVAGWKWRPTAIAELANPPRRQQRPKNAWSFHAMTIMTQHGDSVHLCAIWQRTWKNYGIWLILTLWWRNVIDIEAYSITRSPSLPCRNQKLQDLQVLVGSSVGPSWETGLLRPGASTHWPQWPQWP